jgi:hypothetical protein
MTSTARTHAHARARARTHTHTIWSKHKMYIRRRVKKHPHYRYMFCSWQYCWLGMTKYTWSTPLLPLWCRCDLDSPFLSWGFCHKHGHSNFICTKEEQRAMIHFCGLKVYQVSKCIKCQCSMGIVSCHNRLSVNTFRPRGVHTLCPRGVYILCDLSRHQSGRSISTPRFS